MGQGVRVIPDIVRKPIEVVTARTTGVEFTLLDRKLFNILFAVAYKEMQTRTTHKVSFRELADSMKMGGHESFDRINASLDRLFHGEIDIRYKDDRDEEGILKCHYLSFNRSTRIDGWLEFAFDPILIQFLKNPKIYSLIRLPVIAKLKSPHSLRLYEVMQSKYGLFAKVWKVSVEEAMAHFEIPEGNSNRRLDLFKSRVVDKAVEEVSEVAEFLVEVDYHKAGRGGRVTDMTFKLLPKSGGAVAAAAVMAASSRMSRRDAETVDMFNGRPDNEAPDFREDTMAEARRIVGEGEDFVALNDEWLEAFRRRGYGSDPDETFLAWLRLRRDQRRNEALEGVDVNALMDTFLMDE